MKVSDSKLYILIAFRHRFPQFFLFEILFTWENPMKICEKIGNIHGTTKAKGKRKQLDIFIEYLLYF